MVKKKIWKLKLFLKSVQVLRNWYMYPLVYFGITSNLEVFFKTRDGYQLKIRTGKNSTDIHVFTEIWLEDVYLRNFKLNPDSRIIDVGAHTGLFSLYVSKKCPSGLVYSYEPNQKNFNILNEHIRIHKNKNIIPYNMAVLSKSGKTKLYTNKNDLAGHSVYKKSDEFTEIKSTTIGEIFEKNKIKSCDLLKLDCEGSEHEILINISRELLEKIFKICIEYELFEEHNNLNEIINKLRLCNFSVSIKEISDKNGYLFAEKIIRD